MDENIQVYARVRPMLKRELADNEYSATQLCGTEITVKNKHFSFDALFNEDSTQEEIFDCAAAPILHQFFAGYSGTIFAYGETASGKTFTLFKNGVVQMSVDSIFDNLETNCGLSMSFFEIYNEQMADLLFRGTSAAKVQHNSTLVLREADDVYVEGLTILPVRERETALQLIENGLRGRQTARTAANDRSSRSHAVLTFHLEEKENSETVIGKLNIVDLAGSERFREEFIDGKQFREMVGINEGLLCLGNVISALNEHRKHIPYRNSRLTRVLEDSIGGSARCAIIACVSPAQENVDETLNTLIYAARARSIVNVVRKRVIKVEEDEELIKLQEENQLLKDYIENLIFERKEDIIQYDTVLEENIELKSHIGLISGESATSLRNSLRENTLSLSGTAVSYTTDQIDVIGQIIDSKIDAIEQAVQDINTLEVLQYLKGVFVSQLSKNKVEFSAVDSVIQIDGETIEYATRDIEMLTKAMFLVQQRCNGRSVIELPDDLPDALAQQRIVSNICYQQSHYFDIAQRYAEQSDLREYLRAKKEDCSLAEDPERLFERLNEKAQDIQAVAYQPPDCCDDQAEVIELSGCSEAAEIGQINENGPFLTALQTASSQSSESLSAGPDQGSRMAKALQDVQQRVEKISERSAPGAADSDARAGRQVRPASRLLLHGGGPRKAAPPAAPRLAAPRGAQETARPAGSSGPDAERSLRAERAKNGHSLVYIRIRNCLSWSGKWSGGLAAQDAAQPAAAPTAARPAVILLYISVCGVCGVLIIIYEYDNKCCPLRQFIIYIIVLKSVRMKGDSQKALMQRQASELDEMLRQMQQYGIPALREALHEASPLRLMELRLEARLAYENLQKGRARELAGVASDLQRHFAEVRPLNYPALETYMSCWGTPLRMQQIAAVWSKEELLNEESEFLVKTEFQEFASLLYQNPAVLAVITAGMPSYRRIAAFNAFCTAFEDQEASLLSESNGEMQIVAWLGTQLAKLQFSLMLRVFLSIKRLGDFPGFYIQRGSNIQCVLTDFLHAVQQTRPIQEFAVQFVIPALKRLELMNQSPFLADNVDDLMDHLEQLSGLIKLLLRDLACAMRKPHSLLTALFGVASFATQLFSESVFRHPKFGFHFLDAKLFEFPSTLHMKLMECFEVAFLLGVIVRNAVFEHFLNDKFISTVTFLIDVAISSILGDIVASQSIIVDERLEKLRTQIGKACAPEIQLFLCCTQYHRGENTDLKEYNPSSDRDLRFAVLSELRETHEYQLGATEGIIVIPRLLIEELHTTLIDNTREIDCALNKLNNALKQVLMCDFVDGSGLAQVVQLRFVTNELNALRQFVALECSYETLQTNEILLLQLDESFASAPRSFEAEQEYSRQFYALKLQTDEMKRDDSENSPLTPHNKRYAENLRICDAVKSLEDDIKRVEVEPYENLADEDAFFEHFRNVEEIIAGFREQCAHIDQEVEATRNYVTTMQEQIEETKLSRQALGGNAIAEVQIDFNTHDVLEALQAHEAEMASKTDCILQQDGLISGVFEAVFGKCSSRRQRGSALLSKIMNE